jgi:hypothetical protein
MTTYPDPFTETEIAEGIQFSHHRYAQDENYLIDAAHRVGEVLQLVYAKCGEATTREIVKACGLSNYVSYRG